jgi:hypothetical protein
VEGVYYCTNSKKGEKAGCNNYHGISLLSTAYKSLSNILNPRLSSCTDEIIAHLKCGFRRNRSIADQISYIHQILDEKWEYDEIVRQLFIDFKKAYDSSWREVLFSIPVEFRVSTKLVKGN